MSKKKLDRLLTEARQAYQQNERRKGAQLLNEILQEDFNHQETWEFLYQLYGTGQPLADFQRAFAEEYYPDRLPLLQTAPQIKQPERKPSFFARLFGRFKRAPAQKTPERKLPGEASLPALKRPPIERPAASAGPEQTTETPPATSSILQSAAALQEQKHPSTGSSTEDQRPPAPRPPTPAARAVEAEKVRVLVVDDISQTRETIIRSLRFQDRIEVIGSASDGFQGIQMASELKPDVIIMDINMPELDGIEATQRIVSKVPFTQIIILTVQDDIDYMRKAMMVGARDFLGKPPMIDDLISAIMRAGEYAQRERAKAPEMVIPQQPAAPTGGKIVTIYSPRGGSGCTTIATNLAIALHDDQTSVIVVDGNLQYGDIPVFFNVQSKNTLLHLAPRAEELDPGLIEEVAIQHSSGVNIIAPPRPEDSESINSLQFSQVLQYLRNLYDYVIVDTAHRLGDITLAAIDVSSLVIVVTPHDIPSLARMRKFLDLAPALNLDERRMLVVINRFDKRMGIAPEKVGQAFRQEIAAVVPLESQVVTSSINRGVPFMLQKEALGQPAAQGLLAVAQALRERITQNETTTSES
ncbi:MAG: response regulator [Chloroflexota bacterium]